MREHQERQSEGAEERPKGRNIREGAGLTEAGFVKKFRETAASLSPEEPGRTEAIARIGLEVREKVVHRAPPRENLLLIQLQYISPGFWLLQGAVVVMLVIWVEKTSMVRGGLRDFLNWTSILAAWMGVLGCGDMGRHFSRGVAELEQSCYFNLLQLWTIRMILSGSVDIVVLMFCSVRIAEYTVMPFVQVSLYILVPFVLSNVFCLLFVTGLRGGRGWYGQIVAAFVTGILAAVQTRIPAHFYTMAFIWVWVAALLAGGLLLAWQLRYMYEKIRRGEVLCWN